MSSLEENVQRVAKYYEARAKEYHETTYGIEIGAIDYGRLEANYKAALSGHDALEIASGTGYWTATVASVARSVLATDVNPVLVECARERLKSLANVRFQVADAYTLATLPGGFSAAFAVHWWSHIPRQMRRTFLTALHSRLQPGALVFFTDNLPYHFGDGHRTDEHGDIYERRVLRDGSRFETIKNFPTRAEFADLLHDIADDMSYVEHEPEHLWTISYRVGRK